MTIPTTYTTTTLGCAVDPDVLRRSYTSYEQTQIWINDQTKLHLDGDPAHWRLLAKAIEDAAMEAEGSRAVGFVDLPGLATP